MIVLKEITKTFGAVTALRRLSLEIGEGEIIGLVGPDGAGKTTLLRLMTGVLTKFSGSLTVLGEERIEEIKPYIGYVPQKFSLYTDLTVMENIELLGALYGAEKKMISQKAQEILTFTGLWDFKERLAGKLSGGMKQKLALAAGLMHRPRIFFLDEPTTGVDPVARREFWQLLYQLNKEGTTIVVATPYMDEAELCHRVAMLCDGRLICCKPPRELIHEYPYDLLEIETDRKDLPDLLSGCHMVDLHAFGNKYHLATDDWRRTCAEVEKCLAGQDLSALKRRRTNPSLEDVFVSFAEKKGGA